MDAAIFLLNHIQSPPCQRFVIQTYIGEDHAGQSPLAPVLAPFLPPISEGEIIMQVLSNRGAQCTFTNGPSIMGSLMLSGGSSSQVLRCIGDALSGPTSAVATKIVIMKEFTQGVEACLDAVDTLHITSLDLQAEEVVTTAVLQFLSNPRDDGGWMFPGLQELISVNAPSEILQRFVEVRPQVSTTPIHPSLKV